MPRENLAKARAHDIRKAPRPTANQRPEPLAFFNGCAIGVARSWKPHWEMHPAGDEMLLVLDGEVEVSLVTARELSRTTLRPGSFFVVPRGLWHRPVATGPVTMLFVTPGKGTEVSWDEDPPVAVITIERRKRERGR